MKSINTLVLPALDLQGLINDGAVALLHALEDEGLLTKPADEIAGLYAVVLVEPSWFGRAWDKILKLIDKDGKPCASKYVVVKRVTRVDGATE